MRWTRRSERQVPARVALSRGPGWAPWPMPHPLFALERRLPPWLHPTYRGAVAALGLGFWGTGQLFLLAMLVTWMLMVGPGLGVALFVGALGVTVCAGAAGGMIHGVLRPLHQWGRFGSWLRWLLSIVMAVIAAAILWPDGLFTLRDPALYIIAFGIGALVAGGLLLVDDRQPGRPTPRQFEFLQNRDQLWATADRARIRQRHPHRDPLPRPGEGGERFAQQLG